MNWRGIEQGRRNREAVRAYFSTHLCATKVECAKELGLSVMAVGRHVEAIRAEWIESRSESNKVKPEEGCGHKLA